MDILLREVESGSSDSQYLDRELSSDVVTVGTSINDTIRIAEGKVGEKRATLSLYAKGNEIRFSCKNAKVELNGAQCRSGRLDIGDTIRFDTCDVTRIKAPLGFDLSISYHVAESTDDQKSLGEIFKIDLSQTYLSKRFFSYFFLALFLLTFLALPLFTIFNDRESVNTEATEAVAKGAIFKKQQGFDLLWSSGPLLPAHQLSIGDDCSACHKKPFVKVEDSACEACHSMLSEHISLSSGLAGHSGFHSEELHSGQCQSCHKEHNNPPSIVMRSNNFCTECHSDDIMLENKTIKKAVAFDMNSHAEFKLDLIELDDHSEEPAWRLQSVSYDETLKENSNLKFSHLVHLDDSRVRDSASKGLECGSCHVLSSDEEHFNEISMEKHCRSCHDLKFDVSDPLLELPHANAQVAIKTLESHFVRKLVDPQSQVESRSIRRRPGKNGSNQKCTKGQYQCGLDAAYREASIQFTQRGCVTCHTVTVNLENDPIDRYKIDSVVLNSDWYSSSTFDHKSHLTQSGVTGDSACATCHLAHESDKSNDILIPSKQNCLSCHDEKKGRENISLACIDCHQYHGSAKKSNFSQRIPTLEREK